MKKYMTSALLALTCVSGVVAQTVYEGADIASKDLNGTARFVGMGGAMGALGGDISTIGTNPAGIGVYRSNDAMISFGYSATDTESNYMGGKFDAGRNRWSLDNVGVVFSTKIGNRTALRYVNFGFNYHRSKSFNRNMMVAGDLGGYSQTFQMAAMSDGITKQMWDSGNPFDHNNIGWLSALGYEGYLTAPSVASDNTLNYEHYQSLLGEDDFPYMKYRSRETGGIGQYDFNIAFNFNDYVYLGATLGAYDLSYNKYTLYDETFMDKTGSSTGTGYSLESYNKLTGSGFDFKLGVIVRPFEYSPLRIGAAFHTPTFYKLTWATSAKMISEVYVDGALKKFDIDSYNYLNNADMKYEYQLTTPWTYNLSLGYTVGNFLALGAEYEYKDYSSMRFYDSNGDKLSWESKESQLCMKGVNTFRFGVEYKVVPQFALRAGYNHSTAIFKENAIKALPVNSLATDTDFTNSQTLNNFTLGVGYRGSAFYADLAYKYTAQKAKFYPFVFPGEVDGQAVDVTPEATHLTNVRSQVLLTLGVRF